MRIEEISSLAKKIKENVSKVIVGKDDELDLLMTAFLCGGHVLLDDVPGTGKTVTAKSLAKSVDADFKRIQFTPDLLPSDVTGMSIFNQKSFEFEFREGPVFTNILLADEINRATPRTQSSLLECMEERQATADGVTRALPNPFFVIATQNPVETSGTFPLPEAQLDRFLMRLTPGYPNTQGSLEIIDRFIENSPLEELGAVASAQEVAEAQKSFSAVHVSAPIRKYIVDITEATRKLEDVTLGVSPRGMLSMLRAAQTYAAINGRAFVLPDDIKRLALPVFGHRIITRSSYGASGKAAEIISGIIKNIPVPTENPEADKLV